MFAIIFSLRTILFSSTGIILFVFRPLLGKNSFMDFQNFLLSEILVTLISLKHFSLVWGSNLTKKIPLLLTIVPVFIRTLLKLFLSLDLSIIAFLRDLVIKASFLKQRTFTLTGVISFTISRDTAWKVE